MVCLIFSYSLSLQACGNHVDGIFQKYLYVLSLLSSMANLSAFYRLRTAFLVLFPCLYSEYNTALLFWCCREVCRKIWCLHITVIDAL